MIGDLLGVTAHDLAWQEEALCAQVGGDEWFPDKGGSVRDAKRICMACPVREACLQYALDNVERFGIWGGKSERERRRLLPVRALERWDAA